MENIQLERQYLHKSHSQYPNYKNVKSKANTTQTFSLYWLTRKGTMRKH